MDDQSIVALYWDRSEQAIAETDRKYGAYCYSIAYHALANNEDAEESVSDTYMAAWNQLPPHRPSVLATFLGKITRRKLAFSEVLLGCLHIVDSLSMSLRLLHIAHTHPDTAYSS